MFGFHTHSIEKWVGYRLMWQSSKSDLYSRDCGGWEICDSVWRNVCFSEILRVDSIWCKSIESIVDSMCHRITHRSDHHVTSDDEVTFSRFCRIGFESSPSLFNQALDLITRDETVVSWSDVVRSKKVLEYEIFSVGVGGWYTIDRTYDCLSNGVTIIVFRWESKVLLWLGDLWQCRRFAFHLPTAVVSSSNLLQSGCRPNTKRRETSLGPTFGCGFCDNAGEMEICLPTHILCKCIDRSVRVYSNIFFFQPWRRSKCLLVLQDSKDWMCVNNTKKGLV